MTNTISAIAKYFVIGALLGLAVVVLYYSITRTIFTTETVDRVFNEGADTMVLRTDSAYVVPILFGFLGTAAGMAVEGILYALRMINMDAKPVAKTTKKSKK